MTTIHSMEATTRKIVSAGVILLAATVAACGGSTTQATGTTPSLVSPVAGTTDGAGSFNLLKEGKGKGGHSPAPDIGTTPAIDPDDPETDDADEPGHGHGHGKAIQYEGFTSGIDGNCTDGLIITLDDDIHTAIKTDADTDFQRANCLALEASTAPSIHVHIAARKLADNSLVAIYVRMQGPKFDDGED